VGCVLLRCDLSSFPTEEDWMLTGQAQCPPVVGDGDLLHSWGQFCVPAGNHRVVMQSGVPERS